MKQTLQACVLLASVVIASATARAEEPFTKDRMSVGVTAGFGFAVQGDSLGNPYNVSLGAGAGYTLGGLHLGAMADYFMGDVEYAASEAQETVKVAYDWSHIALDLGYDIAANHIVLRPGLAAGLGMVGVCRNDDCDATSYLLLAPALTTLAPLGDHAFFSFVLRYYFVPGGKSDPYDGVMFGTGLGFAF